MTDQHLSELSHRLTHWDIKDATLYISTLENEDLKALWIALETLQALVQRTRYRRLPASKSIVSQWANPKDPERAKRPSDE